MHQQLVGHQWFSVVVVRVPTVLDLPESVKVPQQDVTEPLGIDTGDLPLLGLLKLQSTEDFADEDRVTAAEVPSVPGSSQVRHQL